MPQLDRRQFLAQSSAGAAGLYLAPQLLAPGRVLGANETIRIAVAGVKGRGRNHIAGFDRLPNVEVVALCDPDPKVLGRTLAKLREKRPVAKGYQDVRKLLEDPSIDVLAIATPNHWHALMTIWACEAGKHVYVEKPVSHNIFEGRQMVRVAAKTGRIVQGGTQSRSATAHREAMQFVHEGGLGKIRWVRGLCYKPRGSIGKVSGAQALPEGLDYDLWCGPAAKEPLRRRRLHYDWHWVWPTGNGDLGNQGVHQMDIARWALGEDGLPKSVTALGGRVGYDDDGTTFNTMVMECAYDKAPLFFEVRGLPRKKGAKQMDRYRGAGIGVIVQGEENYLRSSSNYRRVQVCNPKGEVIKEFRGGGDHFANFIAALRAGKTNLLHASLEDGHVSAALCHLGNALCREGVAADAGRLAALRDGGADWNDGLERCAAHLKANGMELAQAGMKLGLSAAVDPKRERFAEDHAANQHLAGSYRKGFVVEKQT